MKCKYCSGDLTIEDAFCPHCGKTNLYYEAHRRDMAEYMKSYNATKNKVEERTAKYTHKTLIITVISVLVALNLIAILLLINIDDINYERCRKSNYKHAEELALQMSELEKEGDYFGMIEFESAHPMRTYGTAMGEYFRLTEFINDYRFLHMSVLSLIDGEDHLLYTELAVRMNTYLSDMYQIRYEKISNNKNDPLYSEEHIKTMDTLIVNTKALLDTYCGLTKEEADSVFDLTENERLKLLETRLSEVLENE